MGEESRVNSENEGSSWSLNTLTLLQPYDEQVYLDHSRDQLRPEWRRKVKRHVLLFSSIPRLEKTGLKLPEHPHYDRQTMDAWQHY